MWCLCESSHCLMPNTLELNRDHCRLSMLHNLTKIQTALSNPALVPSSLSSVLTLDTNLMIVRDYQSVDVSHFTQNINNKGHNKKTTISPWWVYPKLYNLSNKLDTNKSSLFHSGCVPIHTPYSPDWPQTHHYQLFWIQTTQHILYIGHIKTSRLWACPNPYILFTVQCM